MATIENVRMGDYRIDSEVLATSGVTSCIAVIAVLENGVFVYHADPSDFSIDPSCTLMTTRSFFVKIVSHLRRADPNARFQDVYIVGGWRSNGYQRLRQQIDLLRESSGSACKNNQASTLDEVGIFITSIKLVLLPCNLPKKPRSKQTASETILTDHETVKPVMITRRNPSSLIT